MVVFVEDEKGALKQNEKSWDFHAGENLAWSTPLSQDVIEKARRGDFELKLTPSRALPKSWLPESFTDQKVLTLASAGGQQCPLLAAAGAEVFCVDLSQKMLDLDEKTLKQHSLHAHLIKASAQHYPQVDSDSIDWAVLPLSNMFFPELTSVWTELSRVLKKDGHLLYAFINPICFLFDYEKANLNQFVLKYKQPYSDLTSLNDQEKERFLHSHSPIEFGHSFSEQLGLLCRKGFVIEDLIEDSWPKPDPLSQYFPTFLLVKARRK